MAGAYTDFPIREPWDGQCRCRPSICPRTAGARRPRQRLSRTKGGNFFYGRRFLISAEEIITAFPGSACHQESSKFLVEASDPASGTLKDVGRGYPDQLDGTHSITVAHAYDCDAIAFQPLRWIDLNVFAMMPAVIEVSVAVSRLAQGQTTFETVLTLTPENRRAPPVAFPPVP